MDEDLQSFTAVLAELRAMIVSQATDLLLPSRLRQVAIIAGCLLLAWLLTRWALPRMRAWILARSGWPKWRLRVLLILQRRMQLIFFTGLMWAAVGSMRVYTAFPSRRYILVLIATISTAWLAVAITARLVKNAFLRQIVIWCLWVFVTLYYLSLTDEASDLLDGLAFELGTFRLSLLTLVKAVVVTALLLTGARAIATVTAAGIRKNEDLSPSMRVLLAKLLQILLYSAAFFVGLKAVGVDLTGLAVLSGAIGVGLGFGLQKVVSNLVSGVIILLDKSIKPGDVISIGDTFGWITALGARYVSITTRDGKEFLIPNEDLITGQVVNWSHNNDFVRLDIHFGTAYGDDPHKVRRIAVEAAKTVKRVLPDRAPVCHIVGFGDSSVDYILRFWILDPTGGLTNIRGDVYLALWDAFQENGISIPFPQREVKVLQGGAPDTATGAKDG